MRYLCDDVFNENPACKTWLQYCRATTQEAKVARNCTRPRQGQAVDGTILEWQHSQPSLGGHGLIQTACHCRQALPMSILLGIMTMV